MQSIIEIVKRKQKLPIRGLVLGNPGSGKTTQIFYEIKKILEETEDNVFIIDWGGEYKKFQEKYKNVVVYDNRENKNSLSIVQELIITHSQHVPEKKQWLILDDMDFLIQEPDNVKILYNMWENLKNYNCSIIGVTINVEMACKNTPTMQSLCDEADFVDIFRCTNYDMKYLKTPINFNFTTLPIREHILFQDNQINIIKDNHFIIPNELFTQVYM